jgi:hypothetical protein
MTLTTIPYSLPHEERVFFFLGHADVVDDALLLVMNDDMIKNRRGLVRYAGQSDSRHSMYATCGPRETISLVIPSLGGNMYVMGEEFMQGGEPKCYHYELFHGKILNDHTYDKLLYSLV